MTPELGSILHGGHFGAAANVSRERRSPAAVAAVAVGALALGGGIVGGLSAMDSSNELGSQTAAESPAYQASRIGVDIGNKLPAKPQATPDNRPSAPAPAPEQVSNDQLNNFAELSGPFNPQTGENSISYVALQQARALGLNPSPRALNALTNYVQSHDAHVRQMTGQVAPAPTKLPVGYKIYRPSDDQVRELMRIMGENN